MTRINYTHIGRPLINENQEHYSVIPDWNITKGLCEWASISITKNRAYILTFLNLNRGVVYTAQELIKFLALNLKSVYNNIAHLIEKDLIESVAIGTETCFSLSHDAMDYIDYKIK